MQKKKILIVFGTRPEAIKMAPLVKELKKHSNRYDVVVAVTAQHREMLDQVLELFEIKPEYDLNIMQAGQTLSQITMRALEGLEKVISTEKPDLVLVHGDTSTTFAGSLAAFYQQVSVGHVEAGLRTYDKYAPYPEEMNRQLTGVLTDLHFAPTKKAKENLLSEGVKADDIFVTGNTVIDALCETVKKDFTFDDERLNAIDYQKNRMILVTTHRRENLGEPLRQVYLAIKKVIKEYPDTVVVFPVHKNPAVRNIVEEVLGNEERVLLIEPMDYEPFANLMQKAHIVITDSGGIQEEAPSLGKPVLVLREVTERPEAIKAGTVCLVGTLLEKIYNKVTELLNNPDIYENMSKAVNPYGDGRAVKRITSILDYYWGFSKAVPDEFEIE